MGNVSHYADLGSTSLKIGEEARVPLESFSLEGSVHKNLRYTLHKFEKSGYEFKVLSSNEVEASLPLFRKISEAWLKQKNTSEKGFSLGFFTEEYIKQFPAAVVRKAGETVAFANLWCGAEKEEISIDLMRYFPNSPEGLMDFLFTQIILWSKSEGYRWFNLGMAPLSGLVDRNLTRLWIRFGSFVFRYGEHFYNFQGLRKYKEKFKPEWHPKYLICPGGLAVPRILNNVLSLTSGGLKGAIIK
jgi:phosphatidylglycerol lysyltransferase